MREKHFCSKFQNARGETLEKIFGSGLLGSKHITCITPQKRILLYIDISYTNTAQKYLFSNISCWNCELQTLTFQALSTDIPHADIFKWTEVCCFSLVALLQFFHEVGGCEKPFVLAVCLFRSKLIFFAWEKVTAKLSLLGIRNDPMFVIGKPHRFLHKSNSSQLKVDSEVRLHTFPDQSSRLFRGWHSFKSFVLRHVISQRNNVYRHLFPFF